MNLIVDANILASAVLGKSIDLLLDLAARSVRFTVPVRMMVEPERVIQRKAKLPPGEVFRRVALLADLVDVIQPEYYAAYEDSARRRLSRRGQPDWPVLAASLALEAAIWSNDRDFFGIGVPVWSTANIAHAAVGG